MAGAPAAPPPIARVSIGENDSLRDAPLLDESGGVALRERLMPQTGEIRNGGTDGLSSIMRALQPRSGVDWVYFFHVSSVTAVTSIVTVIIVIHSHSMSIREPAVCVHVCVCVGMWVCVYVCVCISVSLSVCVRVRVCVRVSAREF